MDEQQSFDSFWAYAKERLDSNGLMNWNYDEQGNLKGTSAATDADEDMAMALIFADTKWGGKNYHEDALALCRNIMLHEVEADTFVLKPGDAWGGSACTDISYFSPAAYKIFAEFSGDKNWLKVADKCYEIIAAARNKGTYLVPDWCTAQGTHSYEAETSQGSTVDYYYYEALRCPIRLSWDYLWFGDKRAKEQLTGMTSFFNSIGAANIKAGYTLYGLNTIGSWHDTAFVAAAAAGAMGGGNLDFARSCFSEMKKNKSNHYYEDSVRIFALLVTSGNFPDLYHY
ncbi:MAG: hypothetical protein JXR70_13515 [Spirochaetales bacterium]|nr:hypothetical protein [Spirochaetales bacterium]